MTVNTISPTQLQELRVSGKSVDLIDVRTPVEYRELHVKGASLIPLDRLDPKTVMAGRNGNSKEPLYVLCRSGSRAKQACERFLAAGFVNAIVIEGGTLACEQAGLEMVRGKKAISLERQVRMVAGSLVLLGSVLVAVNPWFALLSGFVGAGLLFAGLTDTCGMALLLGRMPWNQVCEEKRSCCR